MVSDAVSSSRPYGNINVRTPEGRQLVWNPREGEFSTEYTITLQHPRLNAGLWTNIPSIFGGHFMSDALALSKILQSGGYDPETGRRLIGYRSLAAAELAAKQRSLEINRMMQNRRAQLDALRLLILKGQ